MACRSRAVFAILVAMGAASCAVQRTWRWRAVSTYLRPAIGLSFGSGSNSSMLRRIQSSGYDHTRWQRFSLLSTRHAARGSPGVCSAIISEMRQSFPRRSRTVFVVTSPAGADCAEVVIIPPTTRIQEALQACGMLRPRRVRPACGTMSTERFTVLASMCAASSSSSVADT